MCRTRGSAAEGGSSRGESKKQSQDEWIPCILEPEGSSREYRKNWARPIRKIGARPGPDPGRVIP